MHPAPGDDPLWYGDQVAASGGWHGDTFVVELRMLEDAVTFRLEVTAAGHLTITRDVGFEGTEVWEGDPRPDRADAVGALADYVAATNTHDFDAVEPLLAAGMRVLLRQRDASRRRARCAPTSRTPGARSSTRSTRSTTSCGFSRLRMPPRPSSATRGVGVWDGKPASGEGRGTNVFERRDGHWLLVHEHLSSMP